MVKIALYLDSRRPLKDGTYPAKLRVTWAGKQKYYPMGKSYTVEDWEKIMAVNPRKQTHKNERAYLDRIRTRAEETAMSLGHGFTFAKFYASLSGAGPRSPMALERMEAYAKELHKQGRISTASSYRCAAASLLKVWGEDLPLDNIGPVDLQQYEEAMSGASPTTIGIYLRNLRSIFNQAISAGDIDQGAYPFGKYRYQIPTGRNIKKALTLEDVGKIFSAECSPGWEDRARALWCFSYLCNGMNMTDIAHLKWGDIDGDRIVFERSKIRRRTRSAPVKVVVMITEKIRQILDDYGKGPRLAGNYVFGILRPGDDPQRDYRNIQQLISNVNRNIKKVCKRAGIKGNVTTYTARHSFATVLKRSGAPIQYISESLGHKDLKTTENYLGSFEDEARLKWQSKLTDF